MKAGWNIILRHDEDLYGTKVFIIYQKEDGRREIVEPIDLSLRKEHRLNEVLPEPTMQFMGHDSYQFLQGLAEGLVEAGFKPDAIKVADERLVAVGRHLEDMRSLVFKTPPK